MWPMEDGHGGESVLKEDSSSNSQGTARVSETKQREEDTPSAQGGQFLESEETLYGEHPKGGPPGRQRAPTCGVEGDWSSNIGC